MAETRPALYTGGCQCGAIRYALYAEPERVHLCHCRMCQKASGNLFGTGAPVRTRDFAWTRGNPPSFRSSSIGTRQFCPQCGTPLAFQYQDGQDWISPTLGSLDHPERIKPTIEFGVENRLPWLHLAMGMEQKTTEGSMTDSRKAAIASFQHPDADTSQWPPAGARA